MLPDAMLGSWNFGPIRPLRPRILGALGALRSNSKISTQQANNRTWTLHAYPTLRSPESVLPKPMEIPADAEFTAHSLKIKESIVNI